MKNHETTLKNHGNQGGGRALQEKRKNVTHAGSQLTSEMGEGCGAGITEKCDPRGVTTDLLDV